MASGVTRRSRKQCAQLDCNRYTYSLKEPYGIASFSVLSECGQPHSSHMDQILKLHPNESCYQKKFNRSMSGIMETRENLHRHMNGFEARSPFSSCRKRAKQAFIESQANIPTTKGEKPRCNSLRKFSRDKNLSYSN